MKTYLDEYANYLRALLPGVPHEIVFSLAECAVEAEQPEGRALCACNRRWIPLSYAPRAQAFPHPIKYTRDGHGWDDCEVRS